MHRAPLAALVAFTVLVAPAAALALEKCKVKIDAKNGAVRVSASAVAGSPRFGPAPDQVSQPFFNALDCVGGGKAKGCLLADPATVAARTPPPGCTLYLADDGPAACSVWIKGCTPGSRVLEPPASCARVVNGITIFDACP
jgi:hypothetical protein